MPLLKSPVHANITMSDSIKLVKDEIDSIEKERVTVCPMCLKCSAKYTCPRCNSPYCSVDCYRSDKHRDCSEGFYKDCFMEGKSTWCLVN